MRTQRYKNLVCRKKGSAENREDKGNNKGVGRKKKQQREFPIVGGNWVEQAKVLRLKRKERKENADGQKMRRKRACIDVERKVEKRKKKA